VVHMVRVVIDQEGTIDAPDVFGDVLVVWIVVFAEDESSEMTGQVVVIKDARGAGQSTIVRPPLTLRTWPVM